MNQPSLPGKIVHRLILLALALAYLAWMIAALPLHSQARGYHANRWDSDAARGKSKTPVVFS